MKVFFKKNKSSKGFTLIEVLVATAIVSVSLVVLFHTFSKSIQAVKISQDYIRGKWLLQKKMYEFENIGLPEDIPKEYQSFSKPFSIFSWKVEILEVIEEGNLKKIKCTTRLPERSDGRKIQVVSYLKD